MNKVILVVEDDSASRLLLKTLLESAGYEVVEVMGLGAAIRKVSTMDPKPVLCLLDLNLSDMSGINTLLWFRRRCKEVPVVVVTGDSTLGREATLAGAMDYLEKPFTAKEFPGRIERAIARAEVFHHDEIMERCNRLMKELEPPEFLASGSGAIPILPVSEVDTKEHKPVPSEQAVAPVQNTKSSRSGSSIIALVGLVGVVGFFFVLGLGINFDTRADHKPPPEIKQSQPKREIPNEQLVHKLAELKTNPTLSTVTWFRTHPSGDKKQEVITALKNVPCMTNDKYILDSVEAAIIHLEAK